MQIVVEDKKKGQLIRRLLYNVHFNFYKVHNEVFSFIILAGAGFCEGVVNKSLLIICTAAQIARECKYGGEREACGKTRSMDGIPRYL